MLIIKGVQSPDTDGHYTCHWHCVTG